MRWIPASAPERPMGEGLPWTMSASPSIVGTMSVHSKPKLGELLLSSGAIDRLQLDAALGYQKRWGGRLGEIVVDMRFADDERICGALARQLGVPAVDLASREIPQEVIQAVPRAICEKYKLFPFEIVKQERGPARLWVAMSDPTNIEAVDEIRFLSGMAVSVAAAPISSVDAALRRYFLGERQPRQEVPAGPPIVTRSFAEHHYSPQELEEAGYRRPREEAVVDLSDLFDEGGAGRNSSRPQQGNANLQLEVMAKLEALASGRGGKEPVPPWKLVNALVQLLVRQGIVRDSSFLDDLIRS